MAQDWPVKDLSQPINTEITDLFTRTDTLKNTFADTVAPSNPVVGQLFYNTNDGLLYKCTDATTPTWEKVGYVADGTITQAKLKTSIGSVSTSSTDNLILPGGEYGFYPQSYNASDSYDCRIANTSGTTSGYATRIYLAPANGTTYAQQRYVTSSGEVFWIFLLRDKLTGKIIAGYQAPDHPCFGNGNDPVLVPHPFDSYNSKRHEIIVINPSFEDVKRMKQLCCPKQMGQSRKDLLSLFCHEKDINGKIIRPAICGFDENVELEYPNKEITVGIIEDKNDKPLWLKEKSKVIKVNIGHYQPNMVKVRPFKWAGQ